MTGLSHLGQCALAAGRRGWHVLPCGRESGKVPLTPHGVKDASADPAVIERWWRRYPSANLAVACGAASGFWALDLDGAEGLASLAALERAHAPLPATIAQDTPKGGRHHLFIHDPARPVGNTVRVLPAVDTRGDSGFIVVAPSHSSAVGKPWCWLEGRGPDEVAIAAAPDWLVDAVTKPRRVAKPAGGALPPWLDRALGPVAEGMRNSTAASVVGHLLRQFVEPRLAIALLHAWNATHCRPPLPAAELQRIAESIATRELRRWMQLQ